MDEERFQKLVEALELHDASNGTRARYSGDVLGELIGRLCEVRIDIDNGRPLRAAIIMGFRGRMSTMLLEAIGEPRPTEIERRNVYFYKPLGAA